MLAIERRRKITEIVQESHSIKVSEMSKIFNVTEETIRRDLQILESNKVIKKTYGGAVINDKTNVDLSLNIREKTNVASKKLIASKIVDLIEDGETIMLDSSSTAYYVGSEMKNSKKNITIITNSIIIITDFFGNKNFKIISTGGYLKDSSMVLVGPLTEKNIRSYNVDKAIISCKGIHISKGITDSNELEAEVKKVMISSAQKIFLAVDHSKFDKVCFAKVADFNEINYLFTDEQLSDDWKNILQANDIIVQD